jgi:hypothetical protein
MKKSIIWVVLLAGVITTLNSCKKDDPEPIPAIVGTWSRSEYELTDPPAGYDSWDGATQSSFGETGYTFVFKQDGTYSRSFSPVMDDKGTYTHEGNHLKVNPDDPDDLDTIDNIPLIGLEFDVEGDITEIRMVLSQQVKLLLCSDAAIEAAGGNASDVPDDQWHEVDVTMLYKFNKLN